MAENIKGRRGIKSVWLRKIKAIIREKMRWDEWGWTGEWSCCTCVCSLSRIVLEKTVCLEGNNVHSIFYVLYCSYFHARGKCGRSCRFGWLTISHLSFSLSVTSPFSSADEMSDYSSQQTNTCGKHDTFISWRNKKNCEACDFCFWQRKMVSELFSVRVLCIKAAVLVGLEIREL